MCAMETEWQTVKTKHTTQEAHAKADRKPPKQKSKPANGHSSAAARRKSRDLRASFSKERAKPDHGDQQQQESGGDSSADEDDNSPDPIDQPIPPYHVSTFILCPFQQCPVSEPFLDTTALVTHFRNEHHLVFANLHHMYMALDQYINRWAKELESKPVSEFGKKETNDSDVYIIDPGHCALDKEIREQMQRRKLDEVLNIQQRERDVDAKMKRKCLFCKIVCENRATLFKHMFSEHNFNIGLPDNLVNVNEFLDVLEGKLAKLQCLYCEKIFTSAPVLRKHMRKKKHFKIAPKNRQYDRFYVINYLEPGKNWEHFERDNGDSEDERRDDSWADWEEEESEPTMCLFDDEMLPTPKDALEHMKSVHSFDLSAVREAHDLDFYKTVVLINYIRHQSSLNKCFACGHVVDDFSQLAPHMKEKGCFTKTLPKDAEYWKDPKYLLPTYENDPLLTGFEDDSAFDDDVRLPDDEANRKYLSEVMSEALAISDKIAEQLDNEEEEEEEEEEGKGEEKEEQEQKESTKKVEKIETTGH